MLLLRCQVTLWLVFWLVIFAPVTCQIHGLLIPLGETSLHSHHHGGDAGAQCGTFAQTCAPNIAHQPTTSVTMVMALFIAVLPDDISFRSTVKAARLNPRNTAWPHQPLLRQPDQPPRSA